MAPLLEVSGLTKHFGTVAAVQDVSFTIRENEVLGLIGPNGAGKTTLFDCLAGVLPADSGSLRRNGTSLTASERQAVLFYLPDAITPWGAQPLGWILDYVQGAFGGTGDAHASIIESLQLQPLLSRRMAALSKGERKRALLAIGLLTPQPLLVCDEPFDGLDLRQTRQVASLLREQAATRTLLLSIHQIADAARVCDRFVLLSGGRACGEGTLAELSAVAAARGASAAADLDEVFLALT